MIYVTATRYKGTFELNQRSSRWKSHPMDSREQTFAGTYIIEESRRAGFPPRKKRGAASMRIPLNLSHWFNVMPPNRFERIASNGETTGAGELLKSNSFESSGDRKGSTPRWVDRMGRRDVKGQEESEKKNEIHCDIGWQLTRTSKTSPPGRKSSSHFTYYLPSFTPKS